MTCSRSYGASLAVVTPIVGNLFPGQWAARVASDRCVAQGLCGQVSPEWRGGSATLCLQGRRKACREETCFRQSLYTRMSEEGAQPFHYKAPHVLPGRALLSPLSIHPDVCRGGDSRSHLPAPLSLPPPPRRVCVEPTLPFPELRSSFAAAASYCAS